VLLLLLWVAASKLTANTGTRRGRATAGAAAVVPHCNVCNLEQRSSYDPSGKLCKCSFKIPIEIRVSYERVKLRPDRVIRERWLSISEIRVTTVVSTVNEVIRLRSSFSTQGLSFEMIERAVSDCPEMRAFTRFHAVTRDRGQYQKKIGHAGRAKRTTPPNITE